MVLINELTDSSDEINTAWIVATRGVRKVPFTVLLETNIIKLCQDIIHLITSETWKKQLRINVVLTNGAIKIFREQVNNVYKIILDTESSNEFRSFQSQEILSRIKAKKPPKLSTIEEDIEVMLANVSVEDILQMSINIANITEITLREPIDYQREELEYGSIGFGKEILEEPIIEIEKPKAVQHLEPPPKKIKLFEEEVSVRAASVRESSSIEITPPPPISLAQEPITSSSSITEPAAELVSKSSPIKTTPLKKYLIVVSKHKGVYINLRNENIKGNIWILAIPWKVADNMEDNLDTPELYTNTFDEWTVVRPRSQESVFEMRAAPREQEELPIVSPLEIESRRRRISKTPSPNILLQVEEEVPAKIARIEIEPVPEIQKYRRSGSIRESFENTKDRRQTVLQFVNDWNYEKGNLHLPDICGPEINRLQVARLFNDLLHLEKHQLIILTNKFGTLELDCIKKK